MTQPLILYTLRPDGVLAQLFVQFLGASNRVVQLRPLSALPPPISWLARRRTQLLREQQDLRQTIGGLELGLALAAAAPHRFPDGPMWQLDKQAHERRLKVVAWKLEQLAQLREGE